DDHALVRHGEDTHHHLTAVLALELVAIAGAHVGRKVVTRDLEFELRPALAVRFFGRELQAASLSGPEPLERRLERGQERPEDEAELASRSFHGFAFGVEHVVAEARPNARTELKPARRSAAALTGSFGFRHARTPGGGAATTPARALAATTRGLARNTRPGPL